MVNAVDYFSRIRLILSTLNDVKLNLSDSIQYCAHSALSLFCSDLTTGPFMSLAVCDELRRNQPMDLQRGQVESAPLAEKKQRLTLTGVVA